MPTKQIQFGDFYYYSKLLVQNDCFPFVKDVSDRSLMSTEGDVIGKSLLALCLFDSLLMFGLAYLRLSALVRDKHI